MSFDAQLDANLILMVEDLWKSRTIQAAFANLGPVARGLPKDSMHRLFIQLPRITEPDYLPSDEDILRCRVRTCGIHEFEFDYGSDSVRLVDVGGPRNDRKRWVHCFQDVSLLFIVVSFDLIDKVLFEDESVDAFQEQAYILKELLGTKWFRETNAVLVGTHADCLSPEIRPVDTLLQLARSSLSLDPENCALRKAPLMIIPDMCLINPQSELLHVQIETLLRLLCNGPDKNSLDSVRVESISLEPLSCAVQLYMHVTVNQRAMWTLVLIWKHRKQSIVATLPRDILRIVRKFVL